MTTAKQITHKRVYKIGDSPETIVIYPLCGELIDLRPLNHDEVEEVTCKVCLKIIADKNQESLDDCARKINELDDLRKKHESEKQTTAKPTKGPLEVVFRENTIGLALVDSGKAMAVMLELADNPQAIKNAKLFAEAFNVLHETKLTPRQLDDQRRKLFRELQHLTRLLEPLEKNGTLNVPGLATLNGARAALTKAKGETKI